MKLEFSKKTIPEILEEFKDKNTFEWQDNIFNFLRKYENSNKSINLLFQKNGKVFKSNCKKDFIKDLFFSINEFLNLKKGDKVLFALSPLGNEGMILLTQAIIGQFDLYCADYTDEIGIPFIGQEQDSIGSVIDYTIVIEKQIEQSISSLSRIKKVAIINNDDSNKLFKKMDQSSSLYSIISENGYPIGIKKSDDVDYTVLDKISITEDEEGNLIISSENDPELVKSNRKVYISENKFKFIGNNEAKVGSDNRLVNFDAIEEKLKDYIDSNFTVLDFKDQKSGEKVVTLVVESRFVDEIDIPKDVLEEHEYPKQTFYIGEFPKNNEKSSIRKELKKLLLKDKA